ncbi:MAG: NUDIX hydrolase [Clostridiales bacterium]|jgi:ADP-ribose pyrophosphatase YjhB (NUDIX family)|nr:NUDIX hydrolase [Clostridiales bacterium]
MEQRDKNGLTEQEFLAKYSPGDYPRPSVAADIVIFAVDHLRELAGGIFPQGDLKILLIRRGRHPCLGKWALPGGFVNPDETVGEAASRELKEETGIESGRLEQLYTFSDPGRDPRTWVISCAYMALVDGKDIRPIAGDDTDDARWFQVRYKTQAPETPGESLSRLWLLELSSAETVLTAAVRHESGQKGEEMEITENDGLAFDHAKIIVHALCRLRNKDGETGIGRRGLYG